MQALRVAILGQGRSGRDIHGAYLCQDARYQIAAVVDPLEERRQRAKSEYGCQTYSDHTELLQRHDLDLIVNATPSKFHVPLTLAFLEAGYPVLCEKPLASRVADVDRLIAASEKAGKMLAIFQQSRFAPAFRKIQEVIATGVLGDLVQVSIAFNGFSRRYDWQTLRAEMGGNLLNTGPHPLDQALQLLGTENMPQVACFMRNAISYGDAEDHVLLVLSAETGPLIHLEISSCTRYPCFTYNISATCGGLKGDTRRLTWETFDPAAAPELTLIPTPLHKSDGTPAYCSDALEWRQQEWNVPEDTQLFESMSGAFYTMLYKTLTSGEPLEITPQQVRQQIAVIEECQRQNPHIYGNLSETAFTV